MLDVNTNSPPPASKPPSRPKPNQNRSQYNQWHFLLNHAYNQQSTKMQKDIVPCTATNTQWIQCVLIQRYRCLILSLQSLNFRDRAQQKQSERHGKTVTVFIAGDILKNLPGDNDEIDVLFMNPQYVINSIVNKTSSLRQLTNELSEQHAIDQRKN